MGDVGETLIVQENGPSNDIACPNAADMEIGGGIVQIYVVHKEERFGREKERRSRIGGGQIGARHPISIRVGPSTPIRTERERRVENTKSLHGDRAAA